MEVSKVPIRWATSTISSLSKPIRGRYTGMVQTSLVAARDCMVWEATCPMLSPVIRPRHSVSFAIRSAIRIMYRRMMMVSSSWGHFSWM